MAKNKSQLQAANKPSASQPDLAAAAASGVPFFFSATHTQIQHPNYEGPIPHPSLLKEFEAMKPGLAERIIVMAEQEAQHRRAMEQKVLDAQIDDARKYRRTELTGQICGLAIGLAAIFAATYAGIHGAQITGSLIGTTGVTGLVTAFILGRTLMMKQKREEAEQARQNAEAAASLQRTHDETQARLQSASQPTTDLSNSQG